jgi:hypothetical protein
VNSNASSKVGLHACVMGKIDLPNAFEGLLQLRYLSQLLCDSFQANKLLHHGISSVSTWLASGGSCWCGR